MPCRSFNLFVVLVHEEEEEKEEEEEEDDDNDYDEIEEEYVNGRISNKHHTMCLTIQPK